MNQVFLTAAISKAKLTFTPSGFPIVGATLAVKSNVVTKNGLSALVAYLPMKFIGKKDNEAQALAISQLEDGAGVQVEGRVNTRTWHDDDGKRHQKNEFVVTRITRAEVAEVSFAKNGTPYTEQGVNNATVSGNLTQDPYIVPGDVHLTRLSLATDQTVNGKKYTTYLTISCWGDNAQQAATFKKGDGVMVTGRLIDDNWIKDGRPMRELRVEAASVVKTSLVRAEVEVAHEPEPEPVTKAKGKRAKAPSA
jgi:single-strand DNA-binding protein